MSDTPSGATICVAALYRFAPIADCRGVQTALSSLCESVGVLGILLVAPEGLNGTIAGADRAVQAVLDYIRAMPGFADLDVKTATASRPPFLRLKVRIKSEIVTMGQPSVNAARDAGVYVAPSDWNALIADPETLVIDTRNDYEGEIGAFQGAVQPNTRAFRDFPEWFRTEGRALMAERRPARVAMYCTGGIRCEKATAFLRSEGVENVHHLHGGVLRYLETTPADASLWRGECFVFDERVAVGHGLAPGEHSLCRGCRAPVSPQGRASPHYIEGVCCDRCHNARDAPRRQRYAERRRQMQIAEQRGLIHIGQAARR